ncbi:1-acyl-sn-glycerol-3-phosphate acyltransferase [Aeromicrobium panaciterrae]|uniref:1-acyl-sn-glycerol-3-phosphate acyltransferase n=1 Tax=Aeromicrobium panaciterrae TaxID=363861 RepID=A0ABU1UJE4_9ACTN|nr:lysophospholipid acyltransferase family protein [Aeromicrobium panaciterrae]MDR7085283.1 1-acyl-sn-glycerol-3-phosphate acyltransferase [Aeromicrobium panaciterrae]
MIYGFVVSFFRLFNLVTGHKTIRLGERRLPKGTGAVLAINHTSYVDFTYIGIDARRRDKRFVRFMAKIELKNNPVIRFLMWGCQVIAVDRSAGADAYRAAVDELRKGEIVGVYPEATISRSFEIKTLKSGAARMAIEADVPIIPCIVWGSQRIATKGLPRQLGRTKTPVMVLIGEPIPPSGSADELSTSLHAAMTALLHEVQDAYGPHPKGENWVPARLGGSAPTLDEANVMDQQRD